MKIFIDDRELDVPETYVKKLLKQALDQGLETYNEVPIDWRVKAKFATRGMLSWLEKQMGKVYGVGSEKALHCRPPRRDDPNIYLVVILLELIEEVLNGASLNIDTEEGTNRVTAFNLTIQSTGKGGGQDHPDRNVRLRENHSTQIP